MNKLIEFLQSLGINVNNNPKIKPIVLFSIVILVLTLIALLNICNANILNYSQIFDIIDPNKSSIFNGFLEKFEELNTIGKLAIALLISKSIIISCFISISFIYYGDYLITKFNLENKYPKLANIIKLRKQFTKYYLISNILTIAFAILIEIVFSISILIN